MQQTVHEPNDTSYMSSQDACLPFLPCLVLPSFGWVCSVFWHLPSPPMGKWNYGGKLGMQLFRGQHLHKNNKELFFQRKAGRKIWSQWVWVGWRTDTPYTWRNRLGLQELFQLFWLRIYHLKRVIGSNASTVGTHAVAAEQESHEEELLSQVVIQ